jgi:hypothetical protein
VDGERDVETLPEQLSPSDTGDCEFVRICVEGHSQAVTEYELEQKGLTEGNCTPPLIPPVTPPAPPTVTTPPAPVQQVAAAVSQVLPAALPATGMGPGETSSSSLGWGAAAVAVLLGVGGLTALMARRQES